MAVVVLGHDDSKQPKACTYEGRRAPAEVAGVPPPDVKLPQRQARQRAAPRDAPKDRARGQIGERTEKPIEQHCRVGCQHRVIPIRAAPIVVGAQVEREP